MATSLASEFGTLRSFFWPIHRNETRKILPMFLMLFLICFNYSILRSMKDTVVVTASGAEVIPFIKVWVLLPMAILLTYVFTKLSNRFSQEHVVYIIITGFLSFYALFAFVLYPFRDYLHPHAFAQSLEATLPKGFKGLVAMFEYWTFTSFYVLAELWSSIVMTVLFWGIANEITKIHEARRFYALLSVGSNISAILAGQAGNYFSQGGVYNPNLPFGSSAWEQTIVTLVSTIILCGLIVMIIFWWMNKNVLNDPEFNQLHQTVGSGKRKKKKLSMRESFKYLSNSKYLLYVAVLVVAYNLVINLVEVIWKDQLRVLYPNPSDYNWYMNNLTSIIGIVSAFTAFFMVRIIGRYGWTFTAMITPIVLMVTGIGFFMFMFFQDSLSSLTIAIFGMSPLAIGVFFGGAQNCLSKAAKYSVFDATKEMAFIPLEHDVKLKGKAAIDGVGSRLGKSGGSLIHQGLLMISGSLILSAPYVAMILLLVVCGWISAVKLLGVEFASLAQQEEPEPFIKKDEITISMDDQAVVST